MKHMFHNSKSHRKQRAALTLIELLVVILVMSILFAIAIPLYLSSVRNAGTRTVQANIKIIAQAAQVYRLKNGSYPDATQLASAGDLAQPIGSMGPTGVSYELTTTSDVLTVTASESMDRMGGVGSDDTLAYNLETGLWITGGSIGWSL